MKKKYSFVIVLCVIGQMLFSQTLDPSFGTGGQVGPLTSFNPSSFDKAMALQTDGKIVTVGYRHNGNNYDMAVMRLNPDGAPDISFDGDGIKTIDVLGHNDFAFSVVVQPDGKIVLAGYKYYSITYTCGCSSWGCNTCQTTYYDVVVVRLNSNGTFDNTFDGDGIRIVDLTQQDIGHSLALQADGKLIIGGYTQTGGLVIRLNSNGSLDGSFNGSGYVINNFANVIYSVTIQQDGKILSVGYSYLNNQDFAIGRLNANGTFDASFDGDGKKLIDFSGNSEDMAFSMAVTPAGKIVVAGRTYIHNIPNTYYDFAIVQLNSDGSLDNGFSGDGKVTFDFNNAYDDVRSVIVHDNKILVSGQANVNSVNPFVIVCLRDDGTLDNDFDNDGKYTYNFANSSSLANCMIVQPDDKLLVGAYTNGIIGMIRLQLNDVSTTVACPENVITNTDEGFCAATINNIDPVVSPFNTSINYSIEYNGSVIETGTGSVSGKSFGFGVSTITYTAVDEESVSCSFTVTVTDDEPPSFACPSNQNVNLNATCQLLVPNLINDLTGSDNCGTVTFTQSPLVGVLIASSHNQTHNVLITASDGNGNSQTCTVVLTGKDVTKPTFNCPDNQNVDLSATCQLIVPNLIAELTGSDNCGTVTFTQSPGTGASLGSSHNQTHNVVITASDGNGNTQTCTVVLTGKDVTKPTFTCPDNQNINLNTSCQLSVPNLIAALTGNDNCGIVTFTQSPVAGVLYASSHNQTHNVLITASDANGNTQTCTVVLTAKDVTKPTFNCPDNQNIDLNATCQLIVPNLIAELTGSDNCSTVTFTQSPGTGASLASSHNQTHNVVITASDGNGNTQTCTVVLTGKDVTKPTFTCPGNQNVNLNGSCQLVVPNLTSGLTGTDNCGTVTFTQSPVAGASLPSSHNQTHNIIITASDGNGNSQTCTVVLTGKDVTKPTFACPGNQNVNLDGTCQLMVPDLISELAGSDNCGTVTFTQAPAAGASLASSHNQTHNVVIAASDGYGNTQTCMVVLTGKDATRPTFTCPGNQNINLNATCQLLVPNLVAALTGNDNCGTVTFTQSPSAGSSLASSHNQTHNVVITASDGNGNTQTCTVVLTSKDVTKPTFTCPGNQNVNLNGTCQLVVPDLIAVLTGGDNCGTVTFTQSPVAGASLASSHNQTHNVVITANDGSGNTQTCTVVLTGKDVTKPTFICPENSNVNLTTSCQLIVPNLIGALEGTDNCGTVTFTQSPLAGASFSSSNNQTHNVVITANDGNGNTQTCIVVMTAKDVTLPTITCPAPKTVGCDASVLPANTGSATATDNCGGTPVITYADVSGQDPNTSNAAHYNYTITRTWKARDAAGNTNTCNQIITVEDITDPVITCPADKLNIPFDFGQLYATINIGTATATDNCAATANITIGGVRSDNVAITNQQYPLGQTTVEWLATDPSDNSDDCTQTITVRKRNTSVTYTGDMIDNKICVQYSDIINLQAKLTDNEGLATPNNISGRTIAFQLLSGTTVLRTKNATTNASGVAIDSFKIEQAPGMYTVKAIFAGDSYFNDSYDQESCEVKQEDAIVEYNGSQYFTTASSSTLTGSITLAAAINDTDDGNDKRGDIRKAKVTFKDGGPSGTVLGSPNLTVGLVTPGVLTNGLAATTQNNITLNNNDASCGGKIYQVWVGASDHYTGADAGPTPVTLALPGQDFVTGGGNLVVTNSAGTYAGTPNSKMNFGFTMKWNKSGKSLQGNINIVFRKWKLHNGVWQWRVYQIKSNAINSMAVVEVGANGMPVSATNPAVFRKAVINTKANLKDVTDPLNIIDLLGNHNLILDAYDHITANGGVSDKISVTLMAATTNDLLFSSSWVSNGTTAQTITGGNINVRNNSSSSSTTKTTATKTAEMESKTTIEKKEFSVRVYPNPSGHQFTMVVTSELDEKIEIQLYDATGRTLQTFTAKGKELIRFGDKLKSGIYFARVIQGKQTETVKLIKQ